MGPPPKEVGEELNHQFGQPISSFGLIKQKIGHMVVDCYATESAVGVIAALAESTYERGGYGWDIL